MRLRPTNPSPVHRWFAAMTLLVWIGAQALCQSHCLLEACGNESDAVDHHATDHATDVSKSHHGDEHSSPPGDQDNSGESSACQTLKTALTGSGSPPLVATHFPLLYALAPVALPLDATATEPLASFSRQARLREWVFTPEVCLGPAFHSHAPPVLL